jgi:hypothetical protein
MEKINKRRVVVDLLEEEEEQAKEVLIARDVKAADFEEAMKEYFKKKRAVQFEEDDEFLPPLENGEGEMKVENIASKAYIPFSESSEQSSREESGDLDSFAKLVPKAREQLEQIFPKTAHFDIAENFFTDGFLNYFTLLLL